MSVGRDGASDAVSFLRVGVPAVEFGPTGAGHHGPDEWVSISSLRDLPAALEAFLRSLPTARADARWIEPASEAAARGRPEPPPKPKRYWWRFTLASVVIVAVRAAATAPSVLLYSAASPTPLPQRRLQSKVERSSPDARRRAGEHPHPRLRQARQRTGRPGRSDTTMLLRLDPDRTRSR
jgi:hypothetical protein